MDLKRVPAEIRNRIYELVLVADSALDITKSPAAANTASVDESLPPAPQRDLVDLLQPELFQCY